MLARLPPAEKLPLALRKNIRDEFDTKKAELESRLTKVLGTPWTIDINPNAIYPYAKDGWARESLGSCIASYIDGVIWKLESFESNHGPEGIAELNAICHTHAVTIDLDETGKFSYCGCAVSNGQLVVLFNADYLGTNISDALDPANLLKALNEADPAPGNESNISYAARAGIRLDWNPKIEEFRNKLAGILEKPDLKFDPKFDQVFAALKAEAARKGSSLGDDWESRIGTLSLAYFEGLVDSMAYQKFDDEMLREGFNEAVDKGEIALRITEKLEDSSYCETVIEDGILYIQALPTTWGVNVGDAASKLIDKL